jgi:DNA-binding MarR family transcriptional regulator
MAKRNLALADNSWRDEQNAEAKQQPTARTIKKVERAAESVSNDLDKVIHERMRLGIISALAANESLSFNDLKKLLQTTDGNVSVHARKLEEAGYIECVKSFKGRTPLTEYRITAAGRASLEKYLNHMEALIKAMKAV